MKRHTLNSIGALYSMMLTACGFDGCRDIGPSIAELGRNLARAADLVDPIAIKEIYRDMRDLRSTNERLRRAIAELEARRSSVPATVEPTARSMVVRAQCTDEEVATSSFRVFLERWMILRHEDTGRYAWGWGPRAEIIQGGCRPSGQAGEIRINRNTHGNGLFRLSWEMQYLNPGRLDAGRHEFQINVTYEQDSTHRDPAYVRTCRYDNTTCSRFRAEPGNQLEWRSVQFWLRDNEPRQVPSENSSQR